MKIFVTGSAGFLGKAVSAKLTEQGHELICPLKADCDLTKEDSLLKFNRVVYDQIFHLASWTRAGDFSLRHPGEQWIINQRINTNVLAWWQQHQTQAKMICIGTSFYSPSVEAVEERYLDGAPPEMGFSYAMTKRVLYAGLEAMHRQYGLKYLFCVPDTLYGPGYHTDGRPMHLIFDLIRKILSGKLHGKPVVLWGDGNQKREVVFIEDFTNIMLKLSISHDNDIVNIAPGEQFTIKHYAKLICEKAGYDFNAVRFDTTKPSGVRGRCLVIGKLKRLIPDVSFTPLETGLDKTIEWFYQNKDKIL